MLPRAGGRAVGAYPPFCRCVSYPISLTQVPLISLSKRLTLRQSLKFSSSAAGGLLSLA
jgi:hypothetical protein